MVEIALTTHETDGSVPDAPTDYLYSENGTDSGTLPERGRPERIPDEVLYSNRDHLLWDFDQKWDQLGWSLRKINSTADVLPALAPLMKGHEMEPHGIVRCLLQESDNEFGAKAEQTMDTMNTKVVVGWMISIEERTRVLNRLLYDMSHALREDSNTLHQIRSVLKKQELSDEQRRRIMIEKRRVIENRLRSYRQLKAARKEHRDLQLTLDAARAHFARTQLAEFCTSPRYPLNPRNVANALAGVPMIGWRQSAKRCEKRKTEPGARRYRIIQSIDKAIEGSEWDTTVIECVQRALAGKSQQNASWISELRSKWYYLRRAIEAVLPIDCREPERRPYLIASEYFNRLEHPTSVDVLLEKQEQIA